MTSPLDTWLTVLTMLGEWGIVLVIYWELESNRLDHFLETAFSSERAKDRQDIFQAYLEVAVPPNKSRSVAFNELLENNLELRQKCDRVLALMDRIGGSLPLLPPFRRRALRWFPHTVIFLWEILYPYIQYRRQISIPSWAGYFARFARACLREIKRQGRHELVLFDSDRTRKRDIVLSAARLAEIRHELQNG
jgi:hypothetical protein